MCVRVRMHRGALLSVVGVNNLTLPSSGLLLCHQCRGRSHLDLADQEPLQEHLADCADCRRVAGTYLAAAARMPLALEPLQPSPELRGRLMRAVYAEAAQAGRGVAAPRQAPWWQRLW